MKKDIEKLRGLIPYALILMVITLFPLFEKGIMCNDELLLRKWAQGGMKNFFRMTIFSENIDKGRILGVVGNLKFLDYISENKYFFGTINFLFVCIAIGIFVLFVYKLFDSFRLAMLVGCLILAFMPFTFEFAAPNAFIIVTLQPLILLEISLLLFLYYIEKRNKRYIILSAIFFLWSMFLYEFLITYVLLYPVIYVMKTKQANLKEIINRTWVYYATSVFYLILYVGQAYVFPSNYEGTQLGIKSLSDVFRVLRILFCSAMPTYFSFFNEKYRFLFRYYNDGGVQLKNIVQLNIILYCIVLFFLLFNILLNKNKLLDKTHKKGYIKDCVVVIIALIYGVLPALPNSLSLMYQNNLTTEQFIALPVSMYLYFAIMLAISYALWRIMQNCNSKLIGILILFIICILGCSVQIRNTVFTEEQEENYEKIVSIENVLRLDYWSECGNISIYAPSLYTTMNSLAIEPGHWTEFASRYNMLSVYGEEDEDGDAELEIQDNNDFFYYSDQKNMLITTRKQKGIVALNDVQGQLHVMKIGKCIWKNKQYRIYSLK